MALRTSRLRKALVSAGTVPLLVLAACGGGGDDGGATGGGGGGGGGGGANDFGFLVNAENTEIPTVLQTLAENQCAEANGALPLRVETVPQTQLDQRLQLLAGQDALPAQFAAGNAPALTQELAEAGQVLDIGQALEELGATDDIAPAAVSTIESLYGGFNVLPYEYNIEGIWYNEQLFEENGIEVPQTWDDLVAAAQTLQAAGVQPFSASGEQGWPLTRLISGYLFRDLGPDALQRVADGEASLTDPEYVEAAQAVADLGEAGYFGQGVGSIDYDTAISQFLNGQAAMLYMGSWVLGNVNDREQNQVGVENVGFMPFPEVEGGQGSIEQYPSNVGLPMTLSANAYNEEVGAWLECISENYGSVALRDVGRISGFQLNEPVEELPELTEQVQSTIAESEESVLWFEALFNTQATTTSQQNAAQLVTGAISPEEFMELVQNDLDR